MPLKVWMLQSLDRHFLIWNLRNRVHSQFANQESGIQGVRLRRRDRARLGTVSHAWSRCGWLGSPHLARRASEARTGHYGGRGPGVAGSATGELGLGSRTCEATPTQTNRERPAVLLQTQHGPAHLLRLSACKAHVLMYVTHIFVYTHTCTHKQWLYHASCTRVYTDISTT